MKVLITGGAGFIGSHLVDHLNKIKKIKKIIILDNLKDGTKKSRMKVNNQVASNPIGFYESGKNFADLPCRLTHFTRTNFEKYKNGLPFIQHIDKLFCIYPY